jgi:DNA-binding IclR family transcriptional regulator
MSGEVRGVQSIEVGGRILAVMVKATQPMMLRDLAIQAKITPAQAHAYLVSFRKIGIVEQDVATGRYRLGGFALQLGLARMRSFDPLRSANNAIVDFAAELGLMVTNAVWGTHGPTIVQVQESADQVHVNLRAGAVFSLMGTATGRLFAAFLPKKLIEPRIEDEIREARSQDISRGRRVGAATSKAQLARDAAEAREQGYATTIGIPVPGISAVSAPVFDYSGQMQLAVTLIGPSEVVDTNPGSPQTAALIAFTKQLSAQLGYGEDDLPSQVGTLEPPARPGRPRK